MAKINVLLLVAGAFALADCSSITRNQIQHVNYIDLSGDGKYLATWTINTTAETIAFEVIVQTTGYVGFGVSKAPTMDTADIAIGGVHPGGATYFTDRHGTGQELPPEDTVSKYDWELSEGTETATHTTLKFNRKLDTGDVLQDVVIEPDVDMYLIWSYGGTDDLDHHIVSGSRFTKFSDEIPVLPSTTTSAPVVTTASSSLKLPFGLLVGLLSVLTRFM